MAAPAPLTPTEWRAYFEGSPVDKARVAAVEDVSLDGMFLTNRARFSARLKEAYGASGPLTMRVDDQVITVLRQWLDNQSRTPALMPVQEAWLRWVIFDSQMPETVKISSLTRADIRALLRAMEDSSTSGPDIDEYEKRREERYKDFRLKVAHYMVDPTKERLDEIERDPHLQNALRVTKPCGKTAEYVMDLQLKRMGRYIVTPDSDRTFYKKQRMSNVFPGTSHRGNYPEQRAAERPAFGRVAYFQFV